MEVRPPPFPIVGIGASAGGLHALEEFFGKVSPGLGAAYVVVQHLDPDHASVLGELLQRISPLQVIEATDGQRVEPGLVYVIPPNREMEIFDGVLLLGVPATPRGQRMAVDLFFRSLADERGQGAVGVVLSGTGSDGALGLRAIHAAGGLCLVQAPASAKFEGMPAAALRTGVPALVAPAEQLPGLLAGALARPRTAGHQPPPGLAAGVSRILKVLRAQTGRDFSRYKRTSVIRRIERRMAANGLEDVEAYARHLQGNAVEARALLTELLVNVTGFLRDPEAFAALGQEVLPGLVAGKAAGDVIRAWVAGCASGEEAYSLAIQLREALDAARREVRVQLYATDLDADAIATARAGTYPASALGDLSPERLRRWFVRDGDGYRVKKELREVVVFAVHDLTEDPPFTRLDLVSCRNVFIYMEVELQERLLALFHYALRPGGTLVLSPAEGIGSHTGLFEPIDRKWRIYRSRRTEASARAAPSPGHAWVRSPMGSETMKKTQATDGAELTRRALLQSYAPASVLTDLDGTILYVHGDTGHFLRPAPGQATLNVVEMARESLQLDLRAALRQAASKGKVVRCPEVRVKADGQRRVVSLVVRPVPGPKGGARRLLLSFQEEKAPPASRPARGKAPRRETESAKVEELRRTLAATRERLQATIEEQQTAHEELQSANEELQSTNEEAQATNEELETAKEELQSVNEELTTVNAELQAKIEALSGSQDDLKNLFEAIDVGTVFLDEQLKVKRFSHEACRVFRLVATDVGRPLADIKSALADADLVPDAAAVLHTRVPIEREVRTTDGTTYLARVRPYRTADEAVRGVVLVLLDVTARPAAG